VPTPLSNRLALFLKNEAVIVCLKKVEVRIEKKSGKVVLSDEACVIYM